MSFWRDDDFIQPERTKPPGRPIKLRKDGALTRGYVETRKPDPVVLRPDKEKNKGTRE